MTDEEYVIILKNCAFMLADGIKYMKEEQQKQFKEAYEKAIEALSAEPCEDAISREAVLKEMDERHKNGDAITKGFIKNLPPVEPQGFEEYLNQYLGENDQMIIGKDAYEELKYEADEATKAYKEANAKYKALYIELETLKKSVEQTEWISVKDSRKPKIRERVWVTDCDGEVWIMYYNDCDCYFNEFGDVFADDIIAWQPITEPSPYKGDE